jgi:sensitive to high expression protein 9, mitochondrial
MQPAPFRLAQCIRVAFSTAKARPQPGVPRTDSLNFTAKYRLRPAHRLHTGARLYTSRPDLDRVQAQDEHKKKSATPDSASLPKDASSSTQRSTELPSDKQSRRTDLSRRFSHLMDNVQSNIFTASQRLNDLTGYSGIEALKKSIEKQEELVSTTRQAVKAARSAYTSAVAMRSDTQREVNDLLQRKHNWSPSDLERFTSLYRSDHANEQAEQRAHDELGQREKAAEEASNALAKSILARYHEEQIWSDKIRQMSTWGTWGLMGVNILLFLVFQVAVEPWRRRRLVKGFEEKVMEALEKEKIDVPYSPALAAAAAADDHTAEAIATDTTPNSLTKVANEAQLAAAAVSIVDSIAPTPRTSTPSSTAIETAIEILDAAEAIEAAQTNNDPSPLNLLPAVQAEPKTGYAYYRAAIRELFSEKRVVMTQRDVTMAVLEGAAGGAALMGLLLVLVRPR